MKVSTELISTPMALGICISGMGFAILLLAKSIESEKGKIFSYILLFVGFVLLSATCYPILYHAWYDVLTCPCK